MSKLFKVGDVCIGQNFVFDTDRNGIECVITGPLQEREWYHPDGASGVAMLYEIEWEEGWVETVAPINLRPKHPPKRAIDEVVSWESVGWMPMDVKLDRAIKQALKDQVREKA